MTDLLPPHNGTDTSIAAAHAVAAGACDLREQVFAFIDGRGFLGATIAEIAHGLGRKESSICGRIAELRGEIYGEAGQTSSRPRRIFDSGRRRTFGDGTVGCKVWCSVARVSNPPFTPGA